jgi:hypothetical protein
VRGERPRGGSTKKPNEFAPLHIPTPELCDRILAVKAIAAIGVVISMFQIHRELHQYTVAPGLVGAE